MTRDTVGVVANGTMGLFWVTLNVISAPTPPTQMATPQGTQLPAYGFVRYLFIMHLALTRM